MSRVLLFVQTGEGRPKNVGKAYPRALDHRGRARTLVAENNGQRWWAVPWVAREASFADRWWLVECENAEAGRALIACSEATCDHDCYAQCGSSSRILASGSRVA